MSFVQLTRNRCCGAHRQAQQGEKRKKRLRPEIPQRTKKRGEADKKDCCARGGGKEHIKAQLPAADTAGKGEKSGREQQRKQNIERGGETAQRLSVHSQ